MAETKRMTTEEVVGYLLEGEGLDVLRELTARIGSTYLSAPSTPVAAGFLLKRAKPEELIAAIHTISEGDPSFKT